jgi:ComEC/Rec2-related protein
MAAFLAGLYSQPFSSNHLYQAYAVAALVLASAGLRLPARAAAAAAFFALGSTSCGDASGPVRTPRAEGLSVWSGRAGVVTETGLFLETGEGRVWVSGRRCAGSCMEGDSLLVLGFAGEGRVGCASFRVRTAREPLTIARRLLADRWAREIPSRQASSLIAALLVGERSRVPDEVRLAFRDSGASHILSVSGFHVSMIAAAVFLALRGLAGRRGWVVAPALAILSGYVLLTGGKPPAVRSGFTAAAVLCGKTAGVRMDPLVLWSVAAAVVLAVCPGAARDAGAQMSFSAVLALILLSRKFGGRFGGLASSLHSGACVTLALAPLVAGTYGYFQLSSPWATLLSVPFMLALMVLGLACLFGAPVDWPAGALASAWIWMLDSISLARISFPACAWPVWGCALILLLLGARRRGFLRRFR